MNKLLKALMLGVGVLVSMSASAVSIQKDEIGSKFLIMCNAGHVNSRDINRCSDGFGSVSVEEYAESKGVELDSYDIQISQSQVYIVMKVSKK